MQSNEAAVNSIKPRSISRKRYRSVKRTLRSYFLIILTLFIVIGILCANNYMAYTSYNDLRLKFDIAIEKFRTVSVDRHDLNAEKTSLEKENEGLKQNYLKIAAQNEEFLKQMQEIKKVNDELVRRNKELLDDNIALQNSIKMAASVGIKPQNYNKFEGISSRGELKRGTYLGRFLGTAYTPSKDECGNNMGITNSGRPVVPGISIAIDNDYWPFGTVFYIKGLGYAMAMDTGSAIKGKYRFDFAVFDKKFAEALGKKHWEVFLVKMGNGYVEDIKF